MWWIVRVVVLFFFGPLVVKALDENLAVALVFGFIALGSFIWLVHDAVQYFGKS
jgi:uncharacterized membrane protein YoaT (DUF817 family)